eukprot:7571710-Karenia_brevis.AAC.1
MGNRQFGARVNSGDCLFSTISPNEQHTALILRLSRFRQNHPFTRHADAQLQNIASKEAPSLEPVSGGRTQTCSSEKDVVMHLP